jgi:hypothetical protein
VIATLAAIAAAGLARLRRYDALACLLVFFCTWLAVFTACTVWGTPE